MIVDKTRAVRSETAGRERVGDEPEARHDRIGKAHAQGEADDANADGTNGEEKCPDEDDERDGIFQTVGSLIADTGLVGDCDVAALAEKPEVHCDEDDRLATDEREHGTPGGLRVADVVDVGCERGSGRGERGDRIEERGGVVVEVTRDVHGNGCDQAGDNPAHANEEQAAAAIELARAEEVQQRAGEQAHADAEDECYHLRCLAGNERDEQRNEHQRARDQDEHAEKM